MFAPFFKSIYPNCDTNVTLCAVIGSLVKQPNYYILHEKHKLAFCSIPLKIVSKIVSVIGSFSKKYVPM